VRFEYLNGDTGAPTCECRFKVLLHSANDVTVTAIGASPRAAFDNAVGRIERTVRELDRRRVLRTRRRRPTRHHGHNDNAPGTPGALSSGVRVSAAQV
jgi:hypothetical protein